MTSPLARRAASQPGIPHRIAIALLAGSGWLVSGTALGQPAATLELRWNAPVGCPQQSEVRDQIRRLTGATGSTAAPLRAEGTIKQTDSAHFRLKLVMRTGSLVGERTIDATSCANLAGAAAVTLALLMRSDEQPSERALANADADADADHRTTSPPRVTGEQSTQTAVKGAATQPEQSVTRAPEEFDKLVEDRPLRPVAPSRRRWQLIAQAPLAALSLGPLPKPSWGVSLAAGVSYENWRILVGAIGWLGQDLAAADFPGYGAELDRTTGMLKACRALRLSAFEVAPCLVVTLEHISARGTGTGVTPRSEQATWLAIGAGAQGRFHLASWFNVLVGLDAQVETARPVIAIDGVGDLGQLGPAALLVTLGPEWIL